MCIVDDYTVAPSVGGVGIVNVQRALTNFLDMASRTHTGQQKLEDDIEDVLGAYVATLH